METLSVVLQVITMIAVAGVVIFVKTGFSSYSSEKGKNLATKEDIEAITTKIEGIKGTYSTALERLRAELNRTLNIHKLQFETELKIYQEIWKLLIEVQRMAFALRPAVDFSKEPKQERLQRLAEQFSKFSDAVHKSRPFYPKSVFHEFSKFMDLAHGEGVSFQLADKEKDGIEYWMKGQKNYEQIAKQVDHLCDVIQERLGILEQQATSAD